MEQGNLGRNRGTGCEQGKGGARGRAYKRKNPLDVSIRGTGA